MDRTRYHGIEFDWDENDERPATGPVSKATLLLVGTLWDVPVSTQMTLKGKDGETCIHPEHMHQ